MNEAQKFSQRLKEAMKQHGYELRPVVVEREFNLRYWGGTVSFQAARRWLNGEAIPTQDRLQVLAEWLDVDAHWLRFGEQLPGSVSQRRKSWEAKIVPQERQMIEAFMSLPPEKRRLLGEMILALAKK